MTHSQLQWVANEEQARSNRAREQETLRSNLVREAEMHRANLEGEKQTRIRNAFQGIQSLGSFLL